MDCAKEAAILDEEQINQLLDLFGNPVSSGVENDPSWRIYRAGQQH